MHDKLNDKMDNFGLKPSDNVWQGIEKELKKKKRRPVAWWWTGLLLLLLPGILLIDNLNYKWDKDAEPPVAVGNEQKNTASSIPETQLGGSKEAVINDAKAITKTGAEETAGQLPLITPARPENRKVQSKASPFSKNVQTEIAGDKFASPAPQSIAYRDLKNKEIDIAENRIPAGYNYPEDYLKISKNHYSIKTGAIAGPALVEAPMFRPDSGNKFLLPINYKDAKNRQPTAHKKPLTNNDNKWVVGLTTSAFRMSQGSFLEGLGAEKSMMDYYSAPTNAVGQPFTQTAYALDRAQRFGIGAVVRFQAAKRINLITGLELQRRINAVTKTTVFGSLSSTGSYSYTQTGRQRLNNNAWSVQLPVGMGIGFGKHFNLGVQINNAVIFAGSDSLISFSKANNLRGYQPAIAISPNIIIGKKLNWVVSPQLETGLKRSASGKYNNGLGLRVSYFPVKNQGGKN